MLASSIKRSIHSLVSCAGSPPGPQTRKEVLTVELHITLFQSVMINVAFVFMVVTTVIRLVRWVLDILP